MGPALPGRETVPGLLLAVALVWLVLPHPLSPPLGHSAELPSACMQPWDSSGFCDMELGVHLCGYINTPLCIAPALEFGYGSVAGLKL